MTAPLRKVFVRAPTAAIATADVATWHYRGRIDLNAARAEHAALVRLLRDEGVDVHVMRDLPDELPDSVFVYDASLVTTAGVVLMSMGKPVRTAEVALHRREFQRLGVPIFGEIEPPATIEAGDVVWLSERSLVVGRGFRTTDAGISQLHRILGPLGVEMEIVDLPYFHGPTSCMHLMSLVSLLAPDLALVHLEHAPVQLVQLLERHGVRIVTAAPDEFVNSGTISANVLAIAPRRCIMVEGMPKTRGLLEANGCEVLTFPGAEICIKGEGGPTCLTRPLLRLD